MAAMSVAEELASVKREIYDVNEEIKEVKVKLEADNLSDDDKQYWREKENQLREKENKLRDKENKLRDKEMFLMKQKQQQQQQQQQQQPDGKCTPSHSSALWCVSLFLFTLFMLLTTFILTFSNHSSLTYRSRIGAATSRHQKTTEPSAW
jgi:flagellar biosynthesis GTPase FlhF